ncbi:MAG: hypothetical protein ACFCU9_16825, partial [Cyanophyceae cyanobacterium]
MDEAWTENMGKQSFELSPTDLHYLAAFLRKGQMSARQFKRATALLELDRDKPISAVSQTL